MRKLRPAVLVAWAALAAISCGHKGAILAPLTRVPKTIASLATGQKGGRVFLRWVAAGTYIDERPLPSTAVYEIWLLRNDPAEAALERDAAVIQFWDRAFKLAALDVYGRPVDEKTAAAAGPQTSEPKKEFLWGFAMSPEDWKATRLIVGVRVVVGKRDISDFVYMGWWPRKMPAAPGKPRASVFADRIEVRWTAPTLNMDGSRSPAVKGYNVYRSASGEAAVRLNSAPLPASFFMDRAFEFGKPYTYFVRGLIGDKAPYIETDDSESLEVVAADTFPPDPPKELVSVTAVGMVTLIWEAKPGTDTVGFRVWRRTDDEADFKVLTAAAIAENTYTDQTVESGHRYEYAVTAVDEAGNESPRSESLTEIIKDAGP